MRIIFENTDGSIAVIVPAPQCLETKTIQQIAAKDTPAGLPYWIVEDCVIPEDREFREAWEADHASLGAPHGYGSESNEFPQE